MPQESLNNQHDYKSGLFPVTAKKIIMMKNIYHFYKISSQYEITLILLLQTFHSSDIVQSL